MLKLPIWMECIGYIVLGCFVLWVLYALYRNFFKDVFSRRKIVEAKLISKVCDHYVEVKTTVQGKGIGIKGPTDGMSYHKKGVAYRLYFQAKDKCIELDVPKDIYDSLEENTCGLLDYKGNYYYDFKVSK